MAYATRHSLHTNRLDGLRHMLGGPELHFIAGSEVVQRCKIIDELVRRLLIKLFDVVCTRSGAKRGLTLIVVEECVLIIT